MYVQIDNNQYDNTVNLSNQKRLHHQVPTLLRDTTPQALGLRHHLARTWGFLDHPLPIYSYATLLTLALSTEEEDLHQRTLESSNV